MRIGGDIRQRAELIAFERGIGQDEIDAALASGQRLIKFAERHGLSLDWLAYGCLLGLKRQTRPTGSAFVR